MLRKEPQPPSGAFPTGSDRSRRSTVGSWASSQSMSWRKETNRTAGCCAIAVAARVTASGALGTPVVVRRHNDPRRGLCGWCALLLRRVLGIRPPRHLLRESAATTTGPCGVPAARGASGSTSPFGPEPSIPPSPATSPTPSTPLTHAGSRHTPLARPCLRFSTVRGRRRGEMGRP